MAKKRKISPPSAGLSIASHLDKLPEPHPSGRRLGKQPPKHDRRTLQFGKYVNKLGPIPRMYDWIWGINSWPMDLNDSIGDCVPAAMAHHLENWTFHSRGGAMMLPEAAVLQAYEDIGGYVPGRPETDQGCNMLDALRYWMRTGIGGRTIQAYVRSEERRVGKECRFRGWPYHLKKKERNVRTK